MSKSKIWIDTKEIRRNLKKSVANAKRTAKTGMQVYAIMLENDAKATRPWRDRTGDARRSIQGTTGETSDRLLGALAIGVNYGKNLELSNGGKYQVLRPTMNRNRSRFLQTLANTIRF